MAPPFKVAADKVAAAVYVTNISPSATEQTVLDFFSFCGQIASSSIAKDPAFPDGTQHGVVVFENAKARGTALILSHAQIVDRPIFVAAYEASPEEGAAAADGGRPAEVAATTATAVGESAAAPPTEEDVPEEEVPLVQGQATSVPQERKSKTAIMAEMVAAGYVLGENTVQKATAFDASHMNLALKAKVGVEVVKAKMNQIDAQYQVSQKVDAAIAVAQAQVNRIDENLQISQKVSAAERKVNAAVSVVMAQPTVAAASDAVSRVVSSVTTSAGTFRNLTNEEIARLQKEREDSLQGARPATYGAPPPAVTTSPSAAVSTPPTAAAPAPAATAPAPAAAAPAQPAESLI